MAPAGESPSTWPSEYSSKAISDGRFDHINVKHPTCKAEELGRIADERCTGPERSPHLVAQRGAARAVRR